MRWINTRDFLILAVVVSRVPAFLAVNLSGLGPFSLTRRLSHASPIIRMTEIEYQKLPLRGTFGFFLKLATSFNEDTKRSLQLRKCSGSNLGFVLRRSDRRPSPKRLISAV